MIAGAANLGVDVDAGEALLQLGLGGEHDGIANRVDIRPIFRHVVCHDFGSRFDSASLGAVFRL